MTVSIKSRVGKVTGPRGDLSRSFRGIKCAIEKVGTKGRSLRVDMWFGTRKELACLRTVCSHIENMITGVTKAS